MANKHIDGNFDDFLAEEGMLEEVTATAMKRVIAWQIEQEMKAVAQWGGRCMTHINDVLSTS